MGFTAKQLMGAVIPHQLFCSKSACYLSVCLLLFCGKYNLQQGNLAQAVTLEQQLHSCPSP